MNHLPKRKQIRLGRDLYRIPGTIVSITAGVNQRRRVFANPSLASACIDLLGVRSTDQNVSILAYCVMPDHLHVLVAINASGDLVEFMRDFKSRSTRLAW